MAQIIVRDGRIGRDPAEVTEDGGEVLMEYEEDDPARWPDVGDRLTLPNDTEVEVVGINELISPDEHRITAFIGDTW